MQSKVKAKQDRNKDYEKTSTWMGILIFSAMLSNIFLYTVNVKSFGYS